MIGVDDVPSADPEDFLVGRWELREGPRDAPSMTGYGIELVFSHTGSAGDEGPAALPGLPAGGWVSGRSGVNRFQGNYWSVAETEGDSQDSEDRGILAFGPLAVTLMAGPPAAMDAEHAFLKLLSRVRGFRARGTELDLLGDSGVLLARMERVPPAPVTV